MSWAAHVQTLAEATHHEHRCPLCRIRYSGERCPCCRLSPHMAEILHDRNCDGRDYDPEGAA